MGLSSTSVEHMSSWQSTHCRNQGRFLFELASLVLLSIVALMGLPFVRTTSRSPDSNGHLLVLLFFLLFPLLLRSKLGLFLLFLFALISFSFITHIRCSLLKPSVPKCVCSPTSPSLGIVIVPDVACVYNESLINLNDNCRGAYDKILRLGDLST